VELRKSVIMVQADLAENQTWIGNCK